MPASDKLERILSVLERDVMFMTLPAPDVASRVKLLYMKYRLHLGSFLGRPLPPAFRILGRTFHVAAHTDGALLQRVLLDTHAALAALGLLGAENLHAVDIGAHNGETIIAWSLFLKQPVICAFEPDPVSFRNAMLNIGDVPVMLQRVGLSDQAGQGRLDISEGHGGDATYAHASGDATHSVETDVGRGDDLLRGRRVDLIKIDVEGYERHVLEGLRSTLDRCRFLVIEVSLQRRKDHSFHELATILGAARCELMGASRPHAQEGRPAAVDLFFRRQAAG